MLKCWLTKSGQGTPAGVTPVGREYGGLRNLVWLVKPGVTFCDANASAAHDTPILGPFLDSRPGSSMSKKDS